MLTDFFVRDFVRRDPLVFHPETALTEALEALVVHRVNGAPVTDRFGKLIGFFSEKRPVEAPRCRCVPQRTGRQCR